MAANAACPAFVSDSTLSRPSVGEGRRAIRPRCLEAAQDAAEIARVEAELAPSSPRSSSGWASS